MATLERKVGQRVMCNGYEGTIIRVCEWSPSMVEVRVPGGVTCVSMNELDPIDLGPDCGDETLPETWEVSDETDPLAEQMARDLEELGLD